MEALLPGARSVVAVALDYGRPSEPEPGRPRIARYALGRDYHKVLRSKLRRLAAAVEAEGFACRACVDSAPVFERDYARLAGLGWFGKNTMLIDSRRGSWSFLGLLLTTAHWEPDLPAGGWVWDVHAVHRRVSDGSDRVRGRSVERRFAAVCELPDHRAPGGDRARSAGGNGGGTFGCDVCQEVCPFNAERASQPLRGARATEPDLLQDRAWPSLDEIEALSEGEWDVLTRGSPVRRAGLEGLKRNARINRVNAGGATTP